jgi:hypothetical protein
MKWVDFSNIVNTYEKEVLREDTYLDWLKNSAWENYRNSDLTTDDVMEIERFLREWGKMGRVIGKIKKKLEEAEFLFRNIQKAKELRPLFDALKDYKFDHELLDLNSIKNLIVKLSSEVSGILKATCASKVMHMVCPSLFIMWDSKIREHWGVKENAEGYLTFLIRMQVEYHELVEDFAKINSISFKEASMKILSELNQKISENLSIARWIDIYNWTKFTYLTRKRKQS